MQEIRPESLLILILVPIGFVGFLIFFVVGLRKYLKRKDEEKLRYEQIAKQTNWNFSARGEGLENFKSYFEYINQQILPDRIRLGTLPVNILWGNSENDFFASFDFTYNNFIGQENNRPPQYEKGVLLISRRLNLPAFTINRKDFLKENYVNFLGTDVCQIVGQNKIVRVLGNKNMLILFFPKEATELPDLDKIRYRLNLLWKIAKLLEAKQLNKIQAKSKIEI